MIGFEHTTSYVFSTDVGQLEKLNAFVNQGGEPVGFISVSREGGTEATVRTRLLAEHAGDAHLSAYLATLAATFGSMAEATGEGEVLGGKN